MPKGGCSARSCVGHKPNLSYAGTQSITLRPQTTSQWGGKGPRPAQDLAGAQTTEPGRRCFFRMGLCRDVPPPRGVVWVPPTPAAPCQGWVPGLSPKFLTRRDVDLF